MNFGADWHGIGAADEKTARELLACAVDRGVTMIDTADIYGYGASESVLGRIMGKRRSKLIGVERTVACLIRPPCVLVNELLIADVAPTANSGRIAAKLVAI